MLYLLQDISNKIETQQDKKDTNGVFILVNKSMTIVIENMFMNGSLVGKALKQFLSCHCNFFTIMPTCAFNFLSLIFIVNKGGSQVHIQTA